MNKLLEEIYYRAPKTIQNEMVSFLGRKLWKKRYGKGFEQCLEEINSINSLTPEQLKQDIGNRIQETVMLAGNEIPYYRNLFSKLSIDTKEINSLEALNIIPPLEKETLRSRPEEFRKSNTASKAYAVQLTSGSSGTPLALNVDKKTYQLAMALLLHSESRHGVNAGDKRATFAGRMVQRAADMNPPFWRYNRSENQMIYSSYHLNKETVVEYVKGLNEFKPKELIGYPSAIAALASLMKQEGCLTTFQPNLVVTNSETLLDWQRELISDVFRAPVYDYYGTAEYLVFGWNSHVSGYQLQSSLGVAQTVDSNNNEIYEAPGDLLCTTLSNRIMPLIRFRIGDVAVMAKPSSHKDFGGQVLRSIEGRIDDVVISLDGRTIGRLDHIFKGVNGIQECQVIQHYFDQFELVMVPADNYINSIPQTIEENLALRMGHPCKITITLVDKIPRGANGKFKGVISHVSEELKPSNTGIYS